MTEKSHWRFIEKSSTAVNAKAGLLKDDAPEGSMRTSQPTEDKVVVDIMTMQQRYTLKISTERQRRLRKAANRAAMPIDTVSSLEFPA